MYCIERKNFVQRNVDTYSYRLGTPLHFFFFFLFIAHFSRLSLSLSFLPSRLLDGVLRRDGNRETAVHNNTVRLSFVSARFPVFSLRISSLSPRLSLLRSLFFFYFSLSFRTFFSFTSAAIRLITTIFRETKSTGDRKRKRKRKDSLNGAGWLW